MKISVGATERPLVVFFSGEADDPQGGQYLTRSALWIFGSELTIPVLVEHERSEQVYSKLTTSSEFKSAMEQISALFSVKKIFVSVELVENTPFDLELSYTKHSLPAEVIEPVQFLVEKRLRLKLKLNDLATESEFSNFARSQDGYFAEVRISKRLIEETRGQQSHRFGPFPPPHPDSVVPFAYLSLALTSYAPSLNPNEFDDVT